MAPATEHAAAAAASLEARAAAASEAKAAANALFAKGDVPGATAGYLAAADAAEVALAELAVGLHRAFIGTAGPAASGDCSSAAAGAPVRVAAAEGDAVAALVCATAALRCNAANALRPSDADGSAEQARRAVRLCDAAARAEDLGGAPLEGPRRAVAGSRAKAGLRLAQALMSGRRPFAALHATLTALGNATATGSAGPGAVADVAALEEVRREATRAAAIADFDDRVAIADLPPVAPGLPSAGVGAVVSAPVAADRCLFTESELVGLPVNADPGEGGITTELRVRRFAEQLAAMIVAHRAKALPPMAQVSDTNGASAAVYECEDGDGTGRFGAYFDGVRRAMDGSWPRRPADVDAALQASLAAVVADVVRGANAQATAAGGAAPLTDADAAALLSLAMRCRYNIFQAGFFRCCALLNHSCSPTTAMKHRPADHTRSRPAVSLVTVTDVPAGGALTVKYIDDFDFLRGVLDRRALLHGSWLFVCDCPRCVADADPATRCAGELVRCPTSECRGFVSAPFGAAVDEPELEAKLLGTAADACAVVTCPDCANRVPRGEALSADRREALRAAKNELLTASEDAGAAGGVPAFAMGGLFQRISAVRRAAAGHVHAGHWVHRLGLYILCRSLLGPVSTAFQSVAMVATRSGGVAAASGIMPAVGQLGIARLQWLRPGGDGAAAPRDEPLQPADTLDCLAVFLDLWGRIRAFYPASQAWALHAAIARLAAIATAAACLFEAGAAQPPQPAPERFGWASVAAAAAEVAGWHGAMLDRRDRSELLAVVSSSKPPSKLNKALQKALK